MRFSFLRSLNVKAILFFALFLILFQKALIAAPTYTCGYQGISSIDVATLWIEQGGIKRAISLGNGENDSVAYSIAIHQNHLFVVGEQFDGTTYNATLWITNLDGSNIRSITLGNKIENSAGLDIALPNTNFTLRDSFRRFSSVSYQRGI